MRPTPAPAGTGKKPGWADLLAGVKFVLSTRLLVGIMTLDLFAVLLGGAVYLLPVYATDILAVGEVGYGWLKAAPAVGALGTSLALSYLPPIRRAGPTLLWAVAGFGVATIVFGGQHVVRAVDGDARPDRRVRRGERGGCGRR